MDTGIVAANTDGPMRIIDVHCYPNTKEWLACQQPYVDALGKYWNRSWAAKTEDEVIKDFTDAGVDAVLVAGAMRSAQPAGVREKPSPQESTTYEK